MKVVLIIGGAVSGSTAVKKLTMKELDALLLNKIECHMEKLKTVFQWHEKQRINEYFKIDDIISNELVDFVPLTRIGKDVSFEEIYNMGWSCIYFANGAWKDRSFPIKEIEDFDNFYYQNPFVYWFNHYHEPSYNGPKVDIKDDAIVIGGGLASIDVCKITQLELVRQKVESKIENFDIIEMEHKGIPKYLEQYDMKYEDLGINGTTLVYRRNIENMPLTTIPEDATPEMVEKENLLEEKF